MPRIYKAPKPAENKMKNPPVQVKSEQAADFTKTAEENKKN